MAVDPLEMSQASQDEVHRVQKIVQWLLRGGLVVAAVLMAIGLGMKVASGSRHADGTPMFSLGSSGSHADTVMGVGVLVLALTPAFRVLALVVLWGRERDWRFVGVALAVVVTLSCAVIIGHG